MSMTRAYLKKIFHSNEPESRHSRILIWTLLPKDLTAARPERRDGFKP